MPCVAANNRTPTMSKANPKSWNVPEHLPNNQRSFRLRSTWGFLSVIALPPRPDYEIVPKLRRFIPLGPRSPSFLLFKHCQFSAAFDCQRVDQAFVAVRVDVSDNTFTCIRVRHVAMLQQVFEHPHKRPIIVVRLLTFYQFDDVQ